MTPALDQQKTKYYYNNIQNIAIDIIIIIIISKINLFNIEHNLI